LRARWKDELGVHGAERRKKTVPHVGTADRECGVEGAGWWEGVGWLPPPQGPNPRSGPWGPRTSSRRFLRLGRKSILY